MSNADSVDIVPLDGIGQIGAILFACNINAVRSAMAEAMVKHAFPGKVFVDSCGVCQASKMGLPLRSCKKLASI